MGRKDGTPVEIDVVLAGAGHAHLQVLRNFGMHPVPGVRLTLIARDVHAPYAGMLPGLIAGHYEYGQMHIDTGALCRFAGARLYHSAVTGLDLRAKLVLCGGRPPVPYDVLSINTGSTPDVSAVPGASEYVLPAKHIDHFLKGFNELVRRAVETGGRRRVVMAGAGPAGVELLLAAGHRLRRELRAAGHDASQLSLTLLSAAPQILPDFPESFRQRFSALLERQGIRIMTGAAVTQVERGCVHLTGGTVLPADEVLWAASPRAASWLPATGLALDGGGFVKVDETLRAEGHPNIFAAGDVMAFGPRPLPKSGLYAVRAGPVLAENIRRLAAGRPLKAFRPQSEGMSMVTTGERAAIATRNGLVFGGGWVWRWKDWIDRTYLAQFKDLPASAFPEIAPPEHELRPGG